MTTAAILPLTIRNASLENLDAVLERQHDNKLDVVVPARDIRMAGGLLEIDSIGDPQISLDGVTVQTGRFSPTATCDGGIADKLGIPVRYLRKMREAGRLDLLDRNVNAWLADEPAKRYLLRNLRGRAGSPGIARALLSDGYKFVDNLDVLCSVLAGIRAAGVEVEVTQCDLTEARMYVKLSSPQVAMHAPTLLRNYRSPFTGNTGADNPLVFAGFVLSNSEVGHGSCSITPQITVQVCGNGMTITKDAMREIHLGGKLADGVVNWSKETQDAALELVVNQARDAVATFLQRRYLEAKVAEIEHEAGVRVDDVDDTLEYVGKQLKFTTDERKTILSHFVDGADRTAGGVLHAVTSTAQTIDDADRAYELERQGLPAMHHAAQHQR